MSFLCNFSFDFELLHGIVWSGLYTSHLDSSSLTYVTSSMFSIRTRRLPLSPFQFTQRARLSNALDRIKQTQPLLKASSKNIQILNQPTEFYATLLESRTFSFRLWFKLTELCLFPQNKIKSAKRRIFLSSLYVGHDEHELVRTLSYTITHSWWHQLNKWIVESLGNGFANTTWSSSNPPTGLLSIDQTWTRLYCQRFTSSPKGASGEVQSAFI